MSKKQVDEDSDIGSDLEEVNFTRKLQKYFSKCKGKLPFKCFNCGEVDHFMAKCPHKNSNHAMQRNGNKSFQKMFKGQRKHNFFCTSEEEDYSTEEEDEDASKDEK